ncbi:unnamed protein product [Callosobruchus maculatus]|uniref:Uncharacterized protein n=1 Tax=Callosobruchus maculatus TaxID=64391 RepID=A0A653D8V9_CALMS|nr:unnamed protein product [Callosobruchus maculatus]
MKVKALLFIMSICYILKEVDNLISISVFIYHGLFSYRNSDIDLDCADYEENLRILNLTGNYLKGSDSVERQ